MQASVRRQSNGGGWVRTGDMTFADNAAKDLFTGACDREAFGIGARARLLAFGTGAGGPLAWLTPVEVGEAEVLQQLQLLRLLCRMKDTYRHSWLLPLPCALCG